MEKLELKYGCNPNQKPAYVNIDGELPFNILNGKPGYINLLDALNGWQLVREVREATSYPAATSFKHVSPTSVAIGRSIDFRLKKACFIDEAFNIDESKTALAYARARGTDRMSSFGDFIAISDKVDVATAKLIKREVSDGIIAPAYDEEALEILKEKKNGNYVILEMNENYVPELTEKKQVFGITFTQRRNDIKIKLDDLNNIVTKNKNISYEEKIDLVIALIALKYTQSNSVALAKDGQTIGIGAGQQSRIHCTRLASEKADIWHLRQCDKVLKLPFKDGIKRPTKDNFIDRYVSIIDNEFSKIEFEWQELFTKKPEPFLVDEKKEILKTIKNVSMGSDAFFPFSDNIDRAFESGVKNIAEPGGSSRDNIVIEAADKYGMVMSFTGYRLFHH